MIINHFNTTPCRVTDVLTCVLRHKVKYSQSLHCILKNYIIRISTSFTCVLEINSFRLFDVEVIFMATLLDRVETDIAVIGCIHGIPNPRGSRMTRSTVLTVVSYVLNSTMRDSSSAFLTSSLTLYSLSTPSLHVHTAVSPVRLSILQDNFSHTQRWNKEGKGGGRMR